MADTPKDRVGVRPGRTLTVVAVALGAVVLTAGCGPNLSLSTAAPAAVSQASIQAAYAGNKAAPIDQPVVVQADSGRLTKVAVTGPDGPLDGAVTPDGTTWVSTESQLPFGTLYGIKANAVDSRGVVASMRSSFATLVPEHVLKAKISPSDGAEFGVGMPLYVRFNRDVSDRAAVERRLKVTTSTPVQGAWSWQGDDEVQYRPRTYWPANTAITVTANLTGVKAGDGLYGDAVVTHKGRTTDSMVSVVDARTHQMTVRKNGKVIKVVPITTGKAGFETRSGIKVIMTKEETRIMDAATGGTDRADVEYYRVESPFSMRVTWSGEFLHGAPWSVSSQGQDNVSHGCVGMSVPNAKWYFEQSHIGDVVQVVGTNRAQDPGNGITVWNVPWAKWQAGSAL